MWPPGLTAPCPYPTAGSGFEGSLQEGKPLITNISCPFASDLANHSPSLSCRATKGGHSNLFTKDRQRRVPRPISGPDPSPSTPVSLLWGAQVLIGHPKRLGHRKNGRKSGTRKERGQRHIRIFSSNRKCDSQLEFCPRPLGLLSVPTRRETEAEASTRKGPRACQCLPRPYVDCACVCV